MSQYTLTIHDKRHDHAVGDFQGSLNELLTFKQQWQEHVHGAWTYMIVGDNLIEYTT